MSADNEQRNALQAKIDKLFPQVTVYRLTPDELVAYQPNRANEKFLQEAKSRGQENCLMLMLPEHLPFAETRKIVELADSLRDQKRWHNGERIQMIMERGYIAIREPELIANIEEIAPDVIRSFKEEVFPNRPVRRFQKFSDILRDWKKDKPPQGREH